MQRATSERQCARSFREHQILGVQECKIRLGGPERRIDDLKHPRTHTAGVPEGNCRDSCPYPGSHRRRRARTTWFCIGVLGIIWGAFFRLHFSYGGAEVVLLCVEQSDVSSQFNSAASYTTTQNKPFAGRRHLI
jgi:hypothetical protein